MKAAMKKVEAEKEAALKRVQKQETLLTFFKATNKTLRDQNVSLTIQLKTGKKPDPRVFFKG